MLDKKFFKDISADVVMKYRKHIFDPKGGGAKARDVFDNEYKGYKKSYKKASGNLKVNGKPQDRKFAGSTAPVLTGDLYKDFKFQKYVNGGFAFGHTSDGAKVKRLEQLGRPISTKKQPIPDSVAKFILLEAANYIVKQLKKRIKGGTYKI